MTHEPVQKAKLEAGEDNLASCNLAALALRIEPNLPGGEKRVGACDIQQRRRMRWQG